METAKSGNVCKTYEEKNTENKMLVSQWELAVLMAAAVQVCRLPGGRKGGASMKGRW